MEIDYNDFRWVEANGCYIEYLCCNESLTFVF